MNELFSSSKFGTNWTFPFTFWILKITGRKTFAEGWKHGQDGTGLAGEEGGRTPENLYLAVNSFTCTFRYHQSRGTNYLLVGFIGFDRVGNTWAQE